MTKILILWVLILFQNSYADKIDFTELAILASKDSGRDIHLDKSLVNYEIDINLKQYTKKGEIYYLFKQVLEDNDLQLNYVSDKDFFTVLRKEKEKVTEFPEINPAEKVHFYTYKVQNITNKDVSEALSVMPDVKYKYLPQSDMIAYSATAEQHQFIKASLSNTDNFTLQRSIKLTIFTVYNSHLKEFGTKLEKSGLNIDISSLYESGTINTSLVTSGLEFKAYMSFAVDHKYISIDQSPTLLLVNGVESSFNSVKNIPYLNSSATVTNAQSSTTQSYSYKDVGLQIKITPKIKPDWIYLDLNMINEELLDLNDNKPITQKISYINSVKVSKDHPVLLTGFRKVIDTKSGSKIPLLGDVPLFGVLFDYTSNNKEISNINILIEVI